MSKPSCPVCEKDFEPKNPAQRTCGEPACKVEWRRRSRRVSSEDQVTSPKKTLNDTLEDEARKDTERQNVTELKKILSAENRMRRYERVLRECLVEYEPMPPVLADTRDYERAPSEWVVVLGDWHVGQMTKIEETGAIYQQDMTTTRMQVAQVWRALERLHNIDSHGRRIDKIHLLGIGDFIDNDNMRPSQHRKVEEIMTVQAVQAFDLLAWFIRQLLTLVDEVEVDLVGGNHDRLSQKPGDAGLGELDYRDTVAWLIGAFLQRVLASDIDGGRLLVRNWSSFFGYKNVAEQKLVFEHGSSFKWGVGSYGGVPWYGVQNLGPRYEMMLGGADVVVLGHGHRAAVLPNGRSWVVVNGALPATSTYAQAGMKVVQRPLQWLLKFHQDHGLIGVDPLYADVEGTLLPGMVWDDPVHYADLASTTS